MVRKAKKVRIHPPVDEVIHGSCLDRARGLRMFRSKSIDHVITDPPYEEECHSDRMWRIHKGDESKGPSGANRLKDGRNVTQAQLNFDAMDETTRIRVAKEMVRVTKGWIIVFCQDEAIHLWRDALTNPVHFEGWEKGRHDPAKWRRTCIWHKTDAMPKIIGDGPAQGHEPFVAVWAGAGRSIWNGGGRSNVFAYASGRNEHHPTEKPLTLMRDLVLNFSMPGELILDPFAGSGSTLVATKEMDRHYLGFEGIEEYVDVCRERLSLTRTRTMFQMLNSTSRKVKADAAGAKRRRYEKGSFDEE